MCLFDVAHFEFLIEIFKNFCNADCRTLQIFHFFVDQTAVVFHGQKIPSYVNWVSQGLTTQRTVGTLYPIGWVYSAIQSVEAQYYNITGVALTFSRYFRLHDNLVNPVLGYHANHIMFHIWKLAAKLKKTCSTHDFYKCFLALFRFPHTFYFMWSSYGENKTKQKTYLKKY